MRETETETERETETEPETETETETGPERETETETETERERERGGRQKVLARTRGIIPTRSLFLHSEPSLDALSFRSDVISSSSFLLSSIELSDTTIYEP